MDTKLYQNGLSMPLTSVTLGGSFSRDSLKDWGRIEDCHLDNEDLVCACHRKKAKKKRGSR